MGSTKPLRLAREAIKGGRLRDITHATWRFGGEANMSSHPHANLIETQCHGFDQFEDLCGPITSVMAEITDRTGCGYRTIDSDGSTIRERSSRVHDGHI